MLPLFPKPPSSMKMETETDVSKAVAKGLQGSLPVNLTPSRNHPIAQGSFSGHSLLLSFLITLVKPTSNIDKALATALVNTLQPKSILSVPDKIRPHKSVQISETIEVRTYKPESEAPSNVAKIQSTTERLDVGFQRALKGIAAKTVLLFDSLEAKRSKLQDEGSTQMYTAVTRLSDACLDLAEEFSDLLDSADNLVTKRLQLKDIYDSTLFDEYLDAMREVQLREPIEDHLAFITHVLVPQLEPAKAKLERALSKLT